MDRQCDSTDARTAPANKPKGAAPEFVSFEQSFDARVWAAAFVRYVTEKPSIATDVETMAGWFANAIMRGYDERGRINEAKGCICPADGATCWTCHGDPSPYCRGFADGRNKQASDAVARSDGDGQSGPRATPSEALIVGPETT